MSEKALKTSDAADTDSEAEVTDETLAVDGSDDEVEIVIEGEDEPASKPARKSDFHKRILKLNGKISAAENDAEELRRQNEMLKAERDLWKTKDELKSKLDPDNFDTDAEYQAALIRQEIPGLVEKKAKALLAEQNQSTTQAANDQTLQASLRAHYDRADALKVSDYEAAEDSAIAILGNDLSKHIMVESDRSDVLMYHLGKNPAKAESLKRLFESPTTIVKGLLEIGRLEAKLLLKSKRSHAPDPETEVEGGGGISLTAYEKSLDKMREKVAAGTAKMNDLMALKKQRPS